MLSVEHKLPQADLLFHLLIKYFLGLSNQPAKDELYGFADTMKPDLLNENKPISPRKGEIGLNLHTYHKLCPDFGNGARAGYEAQFEFSTVCAVSENLYSRLERMVNNFI